jgi:hypothetical protein
MPWPGGGDRNQGGKALLEGAPSLERRRRSDPSPLLRPAIAEHRQLTSDSRTRARFPTGIATPHVADAPGQERGAAFWGAACPIRGVSPPIARFQARLGEPPKPLGGILSTCHLCPTNLARWSAPRYASRPGQPSEKSTQTRRAPHHPSIELTALLPTYQHHARTERFGE